MATSSCIFCKISRGEDEKTKILYQDETVVVFPDIRPASPHHYLVVPKDHLPNPKQLDGTHVELVEKLVCVGKQVLSEQGGNSDDIRLGFHWPPFHTIGHLHLHVISSTSEMGWLSTLIYKPNSWWFVTADWLFNRLKKMEKS